MGTNKAKDLLFTVLMLYVLAIMGQPLLLLLTFLISGLVTDANAALKVFWWIVIVYSFIATIYFKVKKWNILNVIWHVSYILMMLSVMIYREKVTKPDTFFTASFQVFILLTSVIYPWLMVLLVYSPILLRNVFANQSPSQEKTEAAEPTPSMEDDEMQQRIRDVFEGFLNANPDVDAIRTKTREIAQESGHLKHFVDDILIPELGKLCGAIILFSEASRIPRENLNLFIYFMNEIIPEVISLAGNVPGFEVDDIQSIKDDIKEFVESGYDCYSDKIAGIVNDGIVFFAHARASSSKLFDLRSLEYFNDYVGRGILFKEAVYSYVNGINVHESEKRTVKEYTGSRGYSVGTTLRFGSGLPPIRLGTYESSPQYTTRTRYETTFDMTGTLYCTGSKLLFANEEEAYEIPFDKIVRLTSVDDEEDTKLNVVLDKGITWSFRMFPSANVLQAFKGVIQAAIAVYNESDYTPSSRSKRSFIPYAKPADSKTKSSQSSYSPAPSSISLQSDSVGRENSPKSASYPINPKPQEERMSGKLNYFKVTKKNDVLKGNILEASVSDTEIHLKWIEEGQRRPSLLASGSDGIHYQGSVEYPTLDWKYNCTLTRYSNKSSDLLLGFMEGEGERYVCWFELPRGSL